ncbi:MAG TPA: DUF4252 domain-containing protein [Bacteroides sp.]|nr:DUF4252 domain-containing protein [Bacteroides sp.]
MRKIAFLLPMLLLPLLVNAQKSPIDKLFDKYYGKDGFTTVLVTQDMFEVISNMESEEGELEGTLGKIKRVRVIAMDDDSEVKVEGVNFMEELKGADFDDYKELVVVKNSEQEILVLAKEDNGKLTELLVVVGGEDNVLVSIEGKFTMEDLEALSDLEGLDSLKDVL